MYKVPDHFTQLQNSLKIELEERGVNKHYAGLITKIELGFELLNLLGLEEEPVGVLWVILSDTPIRHPYIQSFTANQKRAIANSRILLPGYAGRFGWETALRDYIRHVPIEMRRYDFDIERLDKQIIQACHTEKDFPNRTEVYQQCLTQILPFRHRNISYVKPGETYDFNAQAEGPPPAEVKIELNESIVALKDTPISWFSEEPRERKPIVITWQQLEEVARFIDDQMGGNEWISRLEQVIYRPASDLQTTQRPESVTFDGFTHLAGMVASGKSTLANLIAAHLVYDHLYLSASTKRRITLIVGDTASSIHLADQFNQWFDLNPETDAPVAVPLLGRTTRDKHLRQLHESQEYKKAVQAKRAHWGERFLNTACPLQGLIPLEKLNKPMIPGTEPCGNLKKSPEGPKKVPRRRSSHLCPLFAICPSQQLYRDMAEAQIWITTSGAMGAATLPAQLESRSIRLGDLIYEQSDIVVFDEIDTVVEWFDRLYAQETKLTGDGDGILDQLDPELSNYLSRNRTAPSDIRRWIEAQRNFHTPVGHILALLQQHNELRQSVERGYFTSRSLFYRFTRRLLGLKEYEDERDDHKRRKNEQWVNSIMPVFDKLMATSDPLFNSLPQTFRADRKITIRTLNQRWKKVEDLSRNDPKRGKVRQEYQEAVDHVAYHLIYLMHQTMNTGDSTQNQDISRRYESWILQFVPDIKEKLNKLRQQLEANNKVRDSYYLHDNEIDTLETLTLRLEFAVNAALLDRHTRIVFYEWDNRPTEVIDYESPYRRVPTTLLNVLPLPPTGRLFGIYHTSDQQNSDVLSTFGYTNIGRAYVTEFHKLRTYLDGRPGPNVLAMSGTSFLPDSTRWHLDIPPKGVLKSGDLCIKAIEDENCWFKFMPVLDKTGEPIRVSGKPDKREAICKMAAALVGKHGDRGGRLGDELRHLEQLAQEDSEKWADRSRLLLLVNSYAQCKWVAEEMKSWWVEMASQIHYLERSTTDGEKETEDSTQFNTSLGRVDIELFAQRDGKILIAPLQAISRGFNILNKERKAAFGAVYFLTRPMPHPHDIPAIAQEINRRTQDWFEDEDFIVWREGDSIYDRGLELRRRAEDYWRRVELRTFYRQLHDEKDDPGSNEGSIKLHANPRRDLAATTAGKIIQAVGRLLRGNVPFHAYFIDAAWAPQQARRLKGEDIPLDTPKTSLLAALIAVMADYVSDPIGKELYEPLLEKLNLTENFDWQPID